MEVLFEVPGRPVGKERPRVTRGGLHSYTPKKTKTYETAVQVHAKAAGAREQPRAVAVGLDVVAVFPFPRAWGRARRDEGETVYRIAYRAGLQAIAKITSPDEDNILKAVQDALQGVAYEHDGQVWCGRAVTIYGPYPTTHVRVWYDDVPAFPERWW